MIDEKNTVSNTTYQTQASGAIMSISRDIRSNAVS